MMPKKYNLKIKENFSPSDEQRVTVRSTLLVGGDTWPIYKNKKSAVLSLFDYHMPCQIR